jgi:CheY-like chemotaxis protein
MTPIREIADRPAHILIVDDERDNSQVLAVMLAPEGYHVMTAASGEEALAMVAQQALLEGDR